MTVEAARRAFEKALTALQIECVDAGQYHRRTEPQFRSDVIEACDALVAAAVVEHGGCSHCDATKSAEWHTICDGCFTYQMRPLICKAVDTQTGVRCALRDGHEGNHQGSYEGIGTVQVSWPNAAAIRKGEAS